MTGYEIKTELLNFLKKHNIKIVCECYSSSESCVSGNAYLVSESESFDPLDIGELETKEGYYSSCNIIIG